MAIRDELIGPDIISPEFFKTSVETLSPINTFGNQQKPLKPIVTNKKDAGLPQVDAPQIDSPQMDLPQVETPEINLPDFNLPKLPQVDVDLVNQFALDLNLGNISIGDIPTNLLPHVDLALQMPEFKLPENFSLDVPSISLPDIDLKGLGLDGIDLSGLNGIDLTGIDLGLILPALGNLEGLGLNIDDLKSNASVAKGTAGYGKIDLGKGYVLDISKDLSSFLDEKFKDTPLESIGGEAMYGLVTDAKGYLGEQAKKGLSDSLKGSLGKMADPVASGMVDAITSGNLSKATEDALKGAALGVLADALGVESLVDTINVFSKIDSGIKFINAVPLMIKLGAHYAGNNPLTRAYAEVYSKGYKRLTGSKIEELSADQLLDIMSGKVEKTGLAGGTFDDPAKAELEFVSRIDQAINKEGGSSPFSFEQKKGMLSSWVEKEKVKTQQDIDNVFKGGWRGNYYSDVVSGKSREALIDGKTVLVTTEQGAKEYFDKFYRDSVFGSDLIQGKSKLIDGSSAKIQLKSDGTPISGDYKQGLENGHYTLNGDILSVTDSGKKYFTDKTNRDLRLRGLTAGSIRSNLDGSPIVKRGNDQLTSSEKGRIDKLKKYMDTGISKIEKQYSERLGINDSDKNIFV